MALQDLPVMAECVEYVEAVDSSNCFASNSVLQERISFYGRIFTGTINDSNIYFR